MFAVAAPVVLERNLFQIRNPPTPMATISINTTATPIKRPALLFEGGDAAAAGAFGTAAGAGFGACGIVTIDCAADSATVAAGASRVTGAGSATVASLTATGCRPAGGDVGAASTVRIVGALTSEFVCTPRGIATVSASPEGCSFIGPVDRLGVSSPARSSSARI